MTARKQSVKRRATVVRSQTTPRGKHAFPIRLAVPLMAVVVLWIVRGIDPAERTRGFHSFEYLQPALRWSLLAEIRNMLGGGSKSPPPDTSTPRLLHPPWA